MFRSISMLIIGFTALINGIHRLGAPAQQVEKSGWLFQHFGSQGIAYGTITLGVVALFTGGIMGKYAWRDLMHLRQLNKRHKTHQS